MNSIANSPLPLRNVLIEMRQVQNSGTQTSALQSSGTLQIDSTGKLGVDGQLQGRQGQRQQSDQAVQKVLVLNGRSARINLGIRTPLRVVQTFVRNGTVVTAPTTLIWEAGTGFTATPRWDGSGSMELELAAQQTSSSSATGSAAGSTVAVPVGTWITVAQSDSDADEERNDLVGSSRMSTHASSEVQVRLTLP